MYKLKKYSQIFNYNVIEENVIKLIKAQFFLQLISASFFLILNIYLSKNNFSDSEIADFISYRFLAVIILAYPLGYFINYKSLKPFFIIPTISLPLVAVTLIILIKYSLHIYLKPIFFLWGVLFTMFQISVLPFIMRYTKKENQTHAISLSFATHSFAMLITGLCIYISNSFFSFEEGNILIFISFVSLISFFYAIRIQEDIINVANKEKKKSYDWILIFQAIIPTLIIAIGAGLTIPFINLFFFHNFYIDASEFALIGGVTSLLVAISSLLVPFIKKKYGFQKSIINTQLIAVCALILLATTAYFNKYGFVLYLAILFYIIRAPLMNMAAPLTSELTMRYVGIHNQEMLSAIVAAIWSGSWYFSSKIFKLLIDLDYNYSQIFYITSLLYLTGILSYYFLIKLFKSKKCNI